MLGKKTETLAVNFESYEVKMLIASDMDATPVAGGLSRYAINRAKLDFLNNIGKTLYVLTTQI